MTYIKYRRRNYKRGLNLSKPAQHDLNKIGIVIFISVFLGCIISGYLRTEDTVVLASTATQVQQEVPTPAPMLIQDDKRGQEIGEIAKEIFGSDANLMLAIGRAESGLNPTRCHIDEREYSCGWLQINLRAHSDKVPGESLEEKAEFLKEPRNCAIIGRVIKAGSGLRAWSVYLNGAYKEFLK